MSHFTVLVKVPGHLIKDITNTEVVSAELELMLAPYQENNMGDCPKEFMEFMDMEDEIREEYENGSVERVRLDDGTLVSPRDRRFKVQEGHIVRYEVPDHLKRVHVPMPDAYGSLDEFAENYCGYERDDETGKYGYWENPNKKWDWWVIGGRWRGMLRIKEGVTPVYGSPGLFGSNDADPHASDVARLRDIDFEGMDMEVDNKVRALWDSHKRLQQIERGEIEQTRDDLRLSFKVDSVLFDLGIKRVVLDDDGNPLTETNEQGQEVRVVETSEFTLDDLLSKHRHYWEFGTYAVLDKDGWHGKGEMGWWGCSSETPDQAANWNKSYVDRWLKNERHDTILAVVDCHI